jgi:hypothetical protein
MFECVNLMDRYGAKYKIGWDECYDPKGRPKEKLDPWYMTVPEESFLTTIEFNCR